MGVEKGGLAAIEGFTRALTPGKPIALTLHLGRRATTCRLPS